MTNDEGSPNDQMAERPAAASRQALPPIEAMQKLIENLEATKTNAELLLSGLK